MKGVLLFVSLVMCSSLNVQGYKIGLGRGDATGPSVEITFMGYAVLDQKGKGMHLRQYARSFIVEDENTNQRIVFVSVDAAMIGHTIKKDVVHKLEKKFGNIYTMDNIALSGTHTHSTPGGFLKYLMYDMPSLGFVKQTYDALVDGIVDSIERAHEKMQKGRIFISKTEVNDANINRSPSSYENNPAEERAMYESDTDKTLIQLRFEDMNENLLGAFNWFAVHPVSMNNTNKFVSTDNVGYASILLEKEQNPDELVGKGAFVGAFASTNLGDVSPNTKGPKCEKTGNPCDYYTSTCPKDEGPCFASGPGDNMFESTKIIGKRIYDGASKLLKERKGREVTGPIGYILQNVDMPVQKGYFNDTLNKQIVEYTGCFPAMGYSFAAGTTDGPGLFLFEQGTVTENPFWNIVRQFLAKPTREDKKCHSPKPILLMTGHSHFPYEWQPRIVPTQVFRLGDVILAALPGEFTTMSGRRMRRNLAHISKNVIGNDGDIILAGLSNIYTSYIATPEEYEKQRYEAASTIYGPHTLTIYMQQYEKLTKAVLNKELLESGPPQPEFDDRLISLVPPVVFDGHPFRQDFGYVLEQPLKLYERGEQVAVKFVSGNPRNNLMRDQTYFIVEQKQLDGSWKTVHTDADWETKFAWVRTNTLRGLSEITFYWDISEDTAPGTYRISHFGTYSYIFGGKYPYSGVTQSFVVE